jgi:hypothetical protein
MTRPESGELDSPRLGEGGTRGEGLGDKEIFSEIGKRAAYHYIKREKWLLTSGPPLTPARVVRGVPK